MSLLAGALSALERELGGGVARRVERVDASRGGGLHLEVVAEPGSGWYTFADGALRPAPPAGDEHVPLSRELARGGAARVLAYRPGRRLVLGLEDAAGALEVVRKGYRRHRSADAWARHLAAELAAAGTGLAVPRLVARDDREETLSFEVAPGARLALGPRAADALFRLGVVLRRLQDARPPDGSAPAHGSAEELAVVSTWLDRHAALAGAPPAGARALLEELSRAQGELGPAPLVPAHRDLHDGQVLAAGDRLVLLDFDLYSLADSALDPANLLAHLSLRALQGVSGATRASAVALGDALLEGLDRSEEPGFWRRLRFYQATSLLRIAVVHALRPRWAHVAPDLVDLARLCLHGARLR